MTLIECFTDSHIDNITACLRLSPDQLIMVGSERQMRQPVKRYRELLRQRGLHTKISACDIDGMELNDICACLRGLFRAEDEFVIDLTGGDTLVVMAVGAVLTGLDSHKQKKCRVQRVDHAADSVIDCIGGSCVLSNNAVALTVEELIWLYGGRLHPNAYQPPEDFCADDLEPLWSIVAEAPKEWNRAIALLNEFESRSDSRMQVFLPLDYLRSSISNFEQKEAVVRELLEKLQRRGIIDDQSTRRALEYTYRSPLLRYCTLKAGNVLEIKTLLEGRSVLEKGTPFFGDCRTSVSIDWDGVLHDPVKGVPETRNEIDVVMMHGTVPLFISCKNGSIGEEELYKLHTVALRFGGVNAKKMLIATDLAQKNAAANRSFAQRAWDMDIFMVADAAELSRTEWQQIFRKAMQ